MEELITSGSDDDDDLKKKVKKCKAIHQGIKEINRGFFSGYAVLKYLVPVENINKWDSY